MKIPQLKIGNNMVFKNPFGCGAMGVGLSNGDLPLAVLKNGCFATMSSIGLCEFDVNVRTYEDASKEAFIEEIERFQRSADDHLAELLAINVMGKLSNTPSLIKAAVDKGIKMIVYGAGLPNKLPEIVDDPSVNKVPIVSSADAAVLILRMWQRRYPLDGGTFIAPDAFILEGPLAGGHIGLTREQILHPEKYSLEIILGELLEAIRPYEQILGRKIPVIAAGGIWSGADIARFLSLGASGAQLGTRYLATYECPAKDNHKQSLIDLKAEDIVIIDSPVGLPGRVVRNEVVIKAEKNEVAIRCPYRCITTCKVKKAGFCIAHALKSTQKGALEDSLIFIGANGWRIDRIISVAELTEELIAGIEASPLTLPKERYI
ncbi:MAG: nitronate monooxygenase [Candidatus Komeilibacteria bacterium CG11_big_fil_rev_8_21_14_0_20_36_20]|uniref:Nitronate monooxygenase n=1 Tax=Candidatus Komeilibacteria bacterium CG11_big_fil_rev_8_21_14_0_20_36_20 TaxID=1974477 RepID=A0A2H0NCD2_9BACT|nr:MAG: nitronate monooxygenase [Candidatus Komeilibacteria bacterium CG11_big_fil_rev_8_21_14_0_20_36_20]PIR81624.1 MAG: nitronate monooxygenase [Candidatus Komeilibacteria bacterium CG10_big_fil_rev_8_21_14_0_10_36_65]PJC55630.1 MAG: nitronate monooxygenase [Candidatus Komeilibacteria bacterium CG_4_9_14_0_2_um_filter_36_13]